MGYPLNGISGELIKRKIIFGAPEKDAVIKIGNTREDLILESAEVVEGGNFVFVRGYLNKSVEYFTTNKDKYNKLRGKEEKQDEETDSKNENENENKNNNKQQVQCQLMCPEPQSIAVDGVIRHTTVWIPFEILVSVEGAKMGDKVVVDMLEVESLFKGSKMQQILEEELIVGIILNDFINVKVVVEEN